MKLSVKSSKFCGIDEVDVTFSKPLSCILGGNGAGKSSVLDAMRDPLGCPIREIAKKGRKALGRDGEKFKNALTLDGKELKSSTSKIPSIAEVEAVIPVSRKAMPYCLDSSKFIGATAAELKDLFSEVLNLDVDWKASAVKDYDCDKALVAGLPENMRAALKKATANQTASKKGKAPTPPEDFNVTLKAGPTKASKVVVADIDKALAGVETALRNARDAKVRAEGSQVSDDDKAKIQADIKGMEKKIADAPDRKNINAELEKAQKAYDTLNADYNNLTAKQTANEEMQESNKDLLKVLCKVCKPKAKKVLNISDDNEADLEKRKAAYIPKIAEIQSQIGKLKEKLEATNDVPVLEGTIAGLQKQLKDADVPVPTKGADIPKMEKQLEGGRALRDSIFAYHEALKHYETELETYNGNSATKDGWSAIVKAIPEIEKVAVADGLTPLRDIFARFTFLNGKIEVSEDLEIAYDGRPYSLMSDSEQYRMSLMLHLAVVEMFQFPFVLVDCGEIVVTPAFKASLLQDLRAMATVRPVIYSLAKNDAEIDTMVQSIGTAKIPDIGVFRMADGKIEELV